MARHLRWLVVLVGILASVQAVRAERREYSVFIDGKEAGQTTIDINQKDDGLTHVATRASVRYQWLLIRYSLTIDSAEWWRGDRLVGLKSQANENGKVTDISISLDNQQLRGRVNGLERTLPAEVWTSTFWKLPAAKFHNKELPIFEIDTGKEYKGQLQYIGTEQLTVMSRLQQCYHFRYTGGPSPTDVWFDAQHRLVRQEFTEMGHKTVTQMIRVSTGGR